MNIRQGKPSDYEVIKAVMNEWWGGRQVEHLQHELFFDHFTDTVFIAENENHELVGFINGFYSQSQPNTAYVHFIGVSPQLRKSGLGRRLYEAFFEKSRADGKTKVLSCTSKVNEASIDFHKSLGFEDREDSRGKIRFEKSI